MALAVPPGVPDPDSPPERPAVVRGQRRPVGRPAKRVAAPHVSVVIVNFCQWRNTARLVRQLGRSDAARSGSAEVVVADNHSPSHPVVRKLRRTTGVKVRPLSRNHGFARAVNRGCREARGEWVLLLNPDVTVPDGFLDEVLGVADAVAAGEPTAGVVGFQLRNRDGTRQASSGPFPTFWGTLGGLLRPRSRRKCEHLAGGGRREVAWATGGCLLVRRACFDQLGGLDERFFLYYEDVDFCRRAALKGWSVWYDPSVRVTHHWPLHARRVPAPLRLMTRHALLTYSRSHWPRWQARAMAGVVRLEAALRQSWAAVRGDATSASLYGHLRALVDDVGAGRYDDARRRVRFAAAFLDPIAAEQDGRTE